MHRRTRGVLALLAAAAVVGCTDSDSSGSRHLLPTAPSRFASPYPSIDNEILALFPTGLETAAGTRWVNVTNKLAAGDHATAEQMFWDLSDWMLKKSGRLLDPSGPLTSLQALNQLIGDMYAIVFPGQPRPSPTLNGDATIGLIFPNAPATIVTPTHRAGIAVQAGSVAQPTLVVIDQNPQGFGTHCAGPLQTTLCQYPLFYRIEEFPHVTLLKPGRAGVCHVNTGPFAPLEGIHDRFRLAHDAPEVLSPNGIRVEGVEILKLVDVSDFMVCTDVSYTVGARTGNRFLDNGLAAVNGALTEIKDFFTPKSAYAIDRGGGGEFSDFSNFNVVDPVRPPSIDFETFPGGGSTSPSCDVPCDLSTQYANQGVTFDFIPTIGNEAIGHASIVLTTNTPDGTPTHVALNAANTGEGGGFLDGTIVMRVNSPTTVTFVLRVNDSAPAVPITAFGPAPIEGPPPQIPESQITRTKTALYSSCADCTQFRQETITITNATGISRIELAGGIYLLMVDDMTLVMPPPIP